MKTRCYNEKDKSHGNYGARGIYICKEWLNFKVFQKWALKTFEPGKSLDRVNNNGPYSPKNCRWATNSEQQINSRITQNRIDARRKTIKIASLKLKQIRNLIYGEPNVRKSKFCSLCKKKLSNKNFGAEKSRPDGLSNYCRKCRSKKYYARKEK